MLTKYNYLTLYFIFFLFKLITFFNYKTSILHAPYQPLDLYSSTCLFPSLRGTLKWALKGAVKETVKGKKTMKETVGRNSDPCFPSPHPFLIELCSSRR